MCSPISESTLTSPRATAGKARAAIAAAANVSRTIWGRMRELYLRNARAPSLFGLGDLDAVPAARLRAVHGRVGEPQQRALAAALRSARREVIAVGRDAQRCGDAQERRGRARVRRFE